MDQKGLPGQHGTMLKARWVFKGRVLAIVAEVKKQAYIQQVPKFLPSRWASHRPMCPKPSQQADSVPPGPRARIFHPPSQNYFPWTVHLGEQHPSETHSCLSFISHRVLLSLSLPSISGTHLISPPTVTAKPKPSSHFSPCSLSASKSPQAFCLTLPPSVLCPAR